MIAKIKTIMDTTPEKLWSHITKPSSLLYVAAPILYFRPLEGADLQHDWEINKEYKLQMHFLNIIPVGYHKIVILRIDNAKNQIISHESGSAAKVWNHTISFKAVNASQIEYSDIVELKAGLLTFFIWLFANIFYRHRQKRWKLLLSKQG